MTFPAMLLVVPTIFSNGASDENWKVSRGSETWKVSLELSSPTATQKVRRKKLRTGSKRINLDLVMERNITYVPRVRARCFTLYFWLLVPKCVSI